MAKNKNLSVVYLERDRLRFYSASLPVIPVLEFPPTAVSDLEVKKTEELRGLVKSFVEQNKLIPSPLIIILSAASCFEKDFPDGNCDEKEPEIQKFIEAVPFDYVRAKTFRLGKVCKVIVANRDLYEVLEVAFGKLGFTLVAVASFTPLGLSLSKNGFDSLVGRQILQRVDWVKQNSFYTYQEAAGEQGTTEKQAQERKRVYILLGVFGVLIIVMTVMIVLFKPFDGKTKEEKSIVSKPATKPPPPPNLTPPGNVASPSAQKAFSSYKIQIKNGSKNLTQAENIRKQLASLGFTDVEVSTATSAGTASTQLTYNPGVPGSVVENIVSELKKLFGNVSVQEGSVSPFDIVITTGSSRVPQSTP